MIANSRQWEIEGKVLCLTASLTSPCTATLKKKPGTFKKLIHSTFCSTLYSIAITTDVVRWREAVFIGVFVALDVFWAYAIFCIYGFYRLLGAQGRHSALSQILHQVL